jgi:hypothetical protein
MSRYAAVGGLLCRRSCRSNMAPQGDLRRSMDLIAPWATYRRSMDRMAPWATCVDQWI